MPTLNERRRPWLAAAALLLAVLAAYQPAWRAGFIWDDDMYVTQNQLLTAPDGLARIWFSRDAPSQYFPFTYTVLRIARQCWGLNPAGYHILNILLHAANALLLWRLLRRLQIPGAWFGAALFVLHPVNVESVAWIAELKNILSLFFYLLTLRAWVEFIEADEPSRARYYALALLAFALALCSKTTACTLPAALALVLWLRGQRLDARRCGQIAPFLALGGAMGLVAIWWERFHQNAVGAAFNIGWLERFLIATRALWFYVGKFFWPGRLAFIYPSWHIDPHDASAWLWPVLTALGGLILVLARRQLPRALLVTVIFYVAALSPLLGFVMEYTFRYTFVADHYQYIALIAPCALAGAAWHWLAAQIGPPRGLFVWLAGSFLLLTLGCLTWRQTGIYHDSETLWRANIALNPNAAISHNNLAAALIDKGEFTEAMAESQLALALDPTSGNAHNNYGFALLHEGRIAEAIPQFRQAEALDPGNPAPPCNLGRAALAQGDFASAVQFFARSLALKPDNAQAQCNCGYALLQLGRVPEAVVAYQTALQLDPDYALAHNDLGSIFERQRLFNDALEQFQIATRLKPDFVEAQCNLGDVLAVLGRRDDALAHYQKALELRPGFAPAQNGLRRLGVGP